MSRKRYCDRCGGEVDYAEAPHLSLTEKADAEGSGNIDDWWDLCATCRSLFGLFIDGHKLQGEGE